MWVVWALLNATNAFAVHNCESHVAIFAPIGSPRVLHDPIILAGLTSVADDEGGVVEIGSTLGAVENSTLVLVEDPPVGLNQDGNGLLSDGSLHLLDVLRVYVSVVPDSDA